MADDIETDLRNALQAASSRVGNGMLQCPEVYARAALAVMRARMMEPTPEMVEAGATEWCSEAHKDMLLDEEVAALFRAMAGVMLGADDG